ncbi:MAG: acyl-CoA thioesterase [Flavobacteriales bacterium]|jgi:acyl-CoA hydrolase|nr:acyl-CoA thioesterase [Flavobacteriales bacterium]|tara:strand:+ start:17861 stop:18370 length:510 start_codon:yes stop_codon:yes gene_type:complete
MKAVTAGSTYASATHIVLPNNTNTLGNLMGGQLLNWLDVVGAISAHRHCRRVVVTASVGKVAFQKAIRLGDIVTIEAKVSRAFTSSMEVVMDVWVEDHVTGEKRRHNEAIYTFVAVDQLGRPIEVPELIPESEDEKKKYKGALRRRQLNLIMAGKMDAKDAGELKSLFE